MKTWQCHSVCYDGNTPCGPIAFSEDGSLLAVAYDQVSVIRTTWGLCLSKNTEISLEKFIETYTRTLKRLSSKLRW